MIPPHTELRVVTLLDERGATIAFHGEFDLDGEARAESAFEEALHASPRRLVLDLSDVSFMDSSAIRWLMLARRRCLKDERPLTIVRASPAAHRVLELCGLDGMFHLVDTPELDASAA